jgi:hypothetical protein
MKWLSLIALVVAVTGCSTAAQRQYQTIVTGNRAINEQGTTCLMAAYNAPEAASVRAHVPFDPRTASLAQLSDPALASPAEVVAIEVWYNRYKACREAVLNGLNNTMPGMVPTLAKQFAAADDDMLLLTQRKLTWGEAVRRGRDRALAVQEALTAEGHRIVSALEQQHEAELERRAAASAEMLNAAAAFSAAAQPSRLPAGAYTLPGAQRMTCFTSGPNTTCNW